jgi:hypothetical protein
MLTAETMDEGRKGIIHREGGPTYAARSQYRYIRLCEVKESLSPNFQSFQDLRHQFHGIDRLVSETLYLLTTHAGGTDSLEIFAVLKSLKIRALENYVCLLRHTFPDSKWSKLMPNSENSS